MIGPEGGNFLLTMTGIQATSQFDVKTLKLGSALHLRNRHPIFLAFRYFYLILVPIGALMIFLGETLIGLLCILLGPVLFMRKVFWQFRLIHGSKSSPQAGQELRWTFGEDGIHQESQGHEKTLEWDDFVDRYLSPKAILLYLQREQYFIVPRDAFASQADFEAVTTLCQNRISQES